MSLYIVLGSVDLAKAADVLRVAIPAWIAVMLVAVLVDVGARAARWRVLLAPIAVVPYRRVLGYTYQGYLANNVLPARLGELVRTHALGEGEGLSRTTVLGTVVVERIVDTVMVVAIAAVSVLVLGVRGFITSAVLLGFAFVTLLVIGLALGVVAHRLPGAARVTRFIERWPKIIELGRRLQDGLAVARRPKTMTGAIILSLAAWTRVDHHVPRRRPGGRHRADDRPGGAHRERRGPRVDRPVRTRLRRHVRVDGRRHRRRPRHRPGRGVRDGAAHPRDDPAGHVRGRGRGDRRVAAGEGRPDPGRARATSADATAGRHPGIDEPPA